MKANKSHEPASDEDQGVSFQFQDGFFDDLGDNVGLTEQQQPEDATTLDTSSSSTLKPNKALKRASEDLKHLTSSANWADFGITRALLKAIFEMGYESPSIIQSKVIPVALEGKDLLATAETGSGKSAAFLVPTLQRLINAGVIKQKDGTNTTRQGPKVGTKALILLPTRELAAQCFDTFLSLTKYLNQNGVLLTGGVPVKEQEAKLRKIPYIVFATPGKVLDILMNSKGIHMDAIEIVVLDEADRLLDLGFKDELLEILKFCNKERQTMLFSATLTEATKDIVPLSLVNPIYIKASPPITVAKTLKMEMLQIPNDDLREAAALYVCKKRYKRRTILFFQTKRAAHRAALIFKLSGLNCGELHGDLSQSKRFECVEQFKNDEVDFLMASELASRGLDIPGVLAVINVHVPTDVVRFVHRVGRTARMGEEGTAITFYVDSERSVVKSMLKATTSDGTTFEKNKIKLSSLALKSYKKKIDELEDKIKETLLEEKVEKEMRKCENTIKRGRDAEPEEPRSWFRSRKEKKTASKDELHQSRMRTSQNLKEESTEDKPSRTKARAKVHMKKAEAKSRGRSNKPGSGQGNTQAKVLRRGK